MQTSTPKRRTVILTLTHNCNLRCSYCYEKHGTDRMSYDKVIEIIEKELNQKLECDEIEFDFFGGEPFLEFNTIRKAVEYVNSKQWKTPYCFFATTNGTLVHGEIKEWLKDHSNFYCGISYDGTPEMQDINRSESSKHIDLSFFKNHYPKQEVKMTLSTHTLDKLYDGVVFLENMGFYVSCNLAYGVDWNDQRNAKVLESELARLIEYYLKNPNIRPCRILDNSIDNLSRNIKKPYRYCGAGMGMIAYDVDGLSYPCQLFMPLSCGKDKSDKAKKIEFPSQEIPESLVEEKCRNCVAKNVCPTCFGANYIEFGDIYRHSNSYCTLTKVITKAKSFLRARQWELGQLSLSEEEELTLLKSILLVQQGLP